MTKATGNPAGRPPCLTAEQDREVFEKTELRKRLSLKSLAAAYGVSLSTIRFAINRERKRRQA